MSFTFKKALVTGGAGFIGSHLVEALLAGECRVTVLDKLSSGSQLNLEPLKDRITFYQADIRQRDILENLWLTHAKVAIWILNLNMFL